MLRTGSARGVCALIGTASLCVCVCVWTLGVAQGRSVGDFAGSFNTLSNLKVWYFEPPLLLLSSSPRLFPPSPSHTV